jgi:hypothetical protein
VLAGAWGSVSLMLRVGQRNDSIILLVLFGIWVLSPFIALGLAALLAKRLVGSDTKDALYSHAGIFGPVRRSCFRAAEGAARFTIHFCALRVLAANRGRFSFNRVHIPQVVSSKVIACRTHSPSAPPYFPWHAWAQRFSDGKKYDKLRLERSVTAVCALSGRPDDSFGHLTLQ